MDDSGQQRMEWRMRLVRAVLERKFSDETLIAMLMAGFEQAQEEGLSDSADICGRVAKECPSATRVALVLEQSMRSLIKLNKQIAVRSIA